MLEQQETRVRSLGLRKILGVGKGNHAQYPCRIIPWAEDPQSWALQKITSTHPRTHEPWELLSLELGSQRIPIL